MSPDEDQYTLRTGDGAVAGELLDELADLYDVVHAGPDQEQGTLYHRESFLSRTRSQIERPGFSIVWARAGEELIGFSFGLTLAAGRWWGGTSAEPPPAEILDADKFAVIELMVSPDWRGRGVGRRLLDELLADRPEPYATLTTRPENPARKMYARWGWQPVGTAQHAPDAPAMDQLVVNLGSQRRQVPGQMPQP